MRPFRFLRPHMARVTLAIGNRSRRSTTSPKGSLRRHLQGFEGPSPRAGLASTAAGGLCSSITALPSFTASHPLVVCFFFFHPAFCCLGSTCKMRCWTSVPVRRTSSKDEHRRQEMNVPVRVFLDDEFRKKCMSVPMRIFLEGEYGRKRMNAAIRSYRRVEKRSLYGTLLPTGNATRAQRR